MADATAMIWVICGAGRRVGKTHLAQRLCAVLPDSVYAKQGHGERRADGPEHFFQTGGEIADFIDEARCKYEHVVVESNELARAADGDIVIFIDGLPERIDVRADVDRLRAGAHILITAAASIRDWKRFLRGCLDDNALREAVFDVFTAQKLYLFKGRPQIRFKLWLMEGGMHVFGAGLARLLRQVERLGTLREGAKAADMSYRHAWSLIKNAEKHHGSPLVIPQPGGSGGGQSVLSEDGRALLGAYARIRESIEALSDECFFGTDNEPPPAAAPVVEQKSIDREAARSVRPLRVSVGGSAPVRDACDVVVEKPLTITIADVGSFTIMCTPCDVEALAVGFALSEGLISSVDDIIDLKQVADPLTVALRIESVPDAGRQRNLIVTSSCGLCGQRNVEKLLAGAVSVPDTMRVSASSLSVVAQKACAEQSLFRCTGGTHSAGIFTPAGELLVVREDIGRHSALDKVIGRCLLDGIPTRGYGVMLSGRVSFELVAKAARAGLEVMAAVSAPSSLALDGAERGNITLCAFVRATRATIYTHPHRIIGTDQV